MGRASRRKRDRTGQTSGERRRARHVSSNAYSTVYNLLPDPLWVEQTSIRHDADANATALVRLHARDSQRLQELFRRDLIRPNGGFLANVVTCEGARFAVVELEFGEPPDLVVQLPISPSTPPDWFEALVDGGLELTRAHPHGSFRLVNGYLTNDFADLLSGEIKIEPPELHFLGPAVAVDEKRYCLDEAPFLMLLRSSLDRAESIVRAHTEPRDVLVRLLTEFRGSAAALYEPFDPRYLLRAVAVGIHEGREHADLTPAVALLRLATLQTVAQLTWLHSKGTLQLPPTSPVMVPLVAIAFELSAVRDDLGLHDSRMHEVVTVEWDERAFICGASTFGAPTTTKHSDAIGAFNLASISSARTETRGTLPPLPDAKDIAPGNEGLSSAMVADLGFSLFVLLRILAGLTVVCDHLASSCAVTAPGCVSIRRDRLLTLLHDIWPGTAPPISQLERALDVLTAGPDIAGRDSADYSHELAAFPALPILSSGDGWLSVPLNAPFAAYVQVVGRLEEGRWFRPLDPGHDRLTAAIAERRERVLPRALELRLREVLGEFPHQTNVMPSRFAGSASAVGVPLHNEIDAVAYVRETNTIWVLEAKSEATPLLRTEFRNVVDAYVRKRSKSHLSKLERKVTDIEADPARVVEALGVTGIAVPTVRGAFVLWRRNIAEHVAQQFPFLVVEEVADRLRGAPMDRDT